MVSPDLRYPVAVAELCEATSDDAVVEIEQLQWFGNNQASRFYDRFAIGRSLAELGNCYVLQ